MEIQNIVATVTLGERLDLNRVKEAFPEAKYDKRRFPGMIYKPRHSNITFLMFGSGKLVVTGASSFSEAVEAVRRIVANFMVRGLLNEPKLSIEAQNVVASGSLGMEFKDMKKVVFKLKKATYKPERFPGMICQLDNPKVSVLLFSNGSFVIVGAKSKADIKKAVRRVKEELKKIG